MKKLTLLLLFAIAFYNIQAQEPANIACENAINLISGASCSPTAGTNLGVENKTSVGCDFYKYVAWYKFTATNTSQIIEVSPITIQDFSIDIFDDNCSTRFGDCRYSGYNSNTSLGINGLTVGLVYKIAISTLNTSQQGTFDICLKNAVPPVNDDCTMATSLTIQPLNFPAVRTNGTTQFATESLTACGGNANHDVWYSFTATQISHRLFLKMLDFRGSAGVELFSGSCGALVSKQCISSGFSTSDNSSVAFSSLTIGETYFFRVYDSGGIDDGGTFSVAITSLPPNDNCSQAIGLNPATGESFSGAVQGSSFDATLSSNDCTNLSHTDDDVWYSFVATQKVHKIKLKGWQSNQGRIEVFKGSCGSLVSINCNSAVVSSDTSIATPSSLNIGENYFFRVYSATVNTNQSLFYVGVTSPIISPIDECENAQLITVSNNATCNNTVVSTLNAFPSAITGTCADSERDIYLKFVATAVQHKVKVASHGSTIFRVSFLSGICGSLQSLRCGGYLDTNSYIGNLTIGQTYFIRITTYKVSSDSYNVCITTPAFQTNDECSGAEFIAIAGDAITCKPITGNLSNSSQSSIADCGVAGPTGESLYRDIWYKFTAATAQQRVRFSKISGSSFKFELYSGSCGTLVYIDCSPSITTYSEKIFTELTVGNTYFIRVFTSYSGDVEFEGCLKAFIPPTNDLCTTAETLLVNPSWSNLNNVTGSTFDSDITVGTNTCGATDSFDVWYKFEASDASQNVVFSRPSLSPNLIGMVVAVYSGACGTLSQVACKVANFSGNNEDVLKLTGLVVGQTYYVKVYSNVSSINNQGFFNIHINNETSIPANNDCATPEALTVYPTALQIVPKEGNTTNATTSSQSVICYGLGTFDDDVWYSFVATKTRIRIKLSSTFLLPNFAIYSGSCASLSYVFCSAAASGSISQEKIIENLTIGQTYLIRVFSGYNSATIRGKIAIGLSEDTDPPVNDICDNAINLIVSSDNTPTFVSSTTVMSKQESNYCSTGGDVWFKFTATSSSHRINYQGFIQSARIGVFSGNCASKTTKACNTALHGTAFTVTGLMIGTEYLVSVGSELSTSNSQGNFKIAVTTPIIPVNDLCTGAIPLVSGAYHSTNLATGDAPDCYDVAKEDVWFSMIATSDRMKVIVENLNTRSAVTAYSGLCGSLNILACSYSSAQYSINKNIINLSDLTVGQTYLIRVISTAYIPLEFKIYAENNPEPEENPLFASSCLNSNLVPNPGFEYYESCPNNFIPTPATPGQWLSPNNHWKIPTMGSSDYFNDCAAFDAPIEIPRNAVFGVQNPRNGTAYGGFFVGGASTYREYLSTKLTSALINGKKYLFSMFVSRSDYYSYSSNNIGFGLNIGDISRSTNDTLIVDKVLLPTVNNVISESENWVNISTTFVADQAYTHLFLGNFKGQKNSLTSVVGDISGGTDGGYSGHESGLSAYYFVDDVLVTEVTNTIACGANNCENVITLVRPLDDITNGTVTKSTNLELNANITIQGTSNVLFQSAKFILMDATQGVFEVKQGVVFEAKIGGCVN